MTDFHYSRVTLLRIIDADTVCLMVDMGFGTRFEGTFRLYGINAPEMNTAAGREAKEFAAEWFASAGTLHIDSYKPDKYGRWLATIWSDKQGVPLNEALIMSGHAVRYLP